MSLLPEHIYREYPEELCYTELGTVEWHVHERTINKHIALSSLTIELGIYLLSMINV